MQNNLTWIYCYGIKMHTHSCIHSLTRRNSVENGIAVKMDLKHCSKDVNTPVFIFLFAEPWLPVEFSLFLSPLDELLILHTSGLNIWNSILTVKYTFSCNLLESESETCITSSHFTTNILVTILSIAHEFSACSFADEYRLQISPIRRSN